ncbi:hypothetical protein CEUSTIGMA_g1143.t1 [Chlamydomonas eustigma]|uniref:Uncharacterized protein n=1 Tax=Chlamydomonas eustigma TaxID=1157962 RepID=A0A250WSQ9_9CHLO|nr:hypothetical protein CEUSTIGMA_g1143.t1 [Chlamydomonas eustigma]|eukprot:GAX73692.1 hypothetical protein CEUSTIGMA_g1143.t1 [Chlamydomonas eustigma]
MSFSLTMPCRYSDLNEDCGYKQHLAATRQTAASRRRTRSDIPSEVLRDEMLGVPLKKKTKQCFSTLEQRLPLFLRDNSVDGVPCWPPPGINKADMKAPTLPTHSKSGLLKDLIFLTSTSPQPLLGNNADAPVPPVNKYLFMGQHPSFLSSACAASSPSLQNQLDPVKQQYAGNLLQAIQLLQQASSDEGHTDSKQHSHYGDASMMLNLLKLKYSVISCPLWDSVLQQYGLLNPQGSIILNLPLASASPVATPTPPCTRAAATPAPPSASPVATPTPPSVRAAANVPAASTARMFKQPLSSLASDSFLTPNTLTRGAEALRSSHQQPVELIKRRENGSSLKLSPGKWMVGGGKVHQTDLFNMESKGLLVKAN